MDDIKDFILQLATYLHYNPEDSVQQFVFDIKYALTKDQEEPTKIGHDWEYSSSINIKDQKEDKQ